MQDKHVFEYAVIRIVPKVEREEFINVGVILYCKEQKFLKAKFKLDEKKIHTLSIEIDLEEINDHLRSFDLICEGGKDSGPIGQLGIVERFRWLTATRSTVLQSSKVHPGFCDDAEKTIERLFTQMVL
jgi:hypothetical protein